MEGCCFNCGAKRQIQGFNAIHHNNMGAQRGGAPDMYAMKIVLHGMWERVVREWIGLDGWIQKVSAFRMRTFHTLGDMLVIKGKVAKRFQEGCHDSPTDFTVPMRTSGLRHEGGVLGAETPSYAVRRRTWCKSQ